MSGETFYGVKACTLQLLWELGLCGYSSGALISCKERETLEGKETAVSTCTGEVSRVVHMCSCVRAIMVQGQVEG